MDDIEKIQFWASWYQTTMFQLISAVTIQQGYDQSHRKVQVSFHADQINIIEILKTNKGLKKAQRRCNLDRQVSEMNSISLFLVPERSFFDGKSPSRYRHLANRTFP